MSDKSNRFFITFNGEIYNYKDIRNELRTLGVIFKSNSDMEVLIEAWKKWGPKCIEKLNGMFAFSLFDRLKRKCI